MTLLERFDRRLRTLKLPPGPALVAVSGGGDSLALLDLLTRARSAGSLVLHVGHVDHGIHPASAAIAAAVRDAAGRYGIGFHLERHELGPNASETTARKARYESLERLADGVGAELIFTAHHLDDQVETILMRVFRGSGPAGLAGIASRRGRLVRPLLPFRREELATYLRDQGLDAWDDPANADPRHDRVWIRRTVLPELRVRYPEVDRRIVSLGRQAARQREAWDGLLERLRELDLQSECDGVSVAASPLHGYDSSARRALLGALGRRCDCPIGPARVAQIERLLIGGRSGAVAELGAGCAAELSFGRLRLFRPAGHPAPWKPMALDGPAGNLAAGKWRITWRLESSAPGAPLEREASSSWLAPGAYVVRPWRPGDRIRPLGFAGRRLVVRCMQDARIARSLRGTWPIVESGGTVVWVPGVCRSADCLPTQGHEALRIDAHFA